jgi:hypothetical protein
LDLLHGFEPLFKHADIGMVGIIGQNNIGLSTPSIYA